MVCISPSYFLLCRTESTSCIVHITLAVLNRPVLLWGSHENSSITFVSECGFASQNYNFEIQVWGLNKFKFFKHNLFITVKFHFAPKPCRTVSCAWLECSNRNYVSFAPVLWVSEDYRCEAFVGYDVLYIVSGSVGNCPCDWSTHEKGWFEISLTFLKNKDLC